MKTRKIHICEFLKKYKKIDKDLFVSEGKESLYYVDQYKIKISVEECIDGLAHEYFETFIKPKDAPVRPSHFRYINYWIYDENYREFHCCFSTDEYRNREYRDTDYDFYFRLDTLIAFIEEKNKDINKLESVFDEDFVSYRRNINNTLIAVKDDKYKLENLIDQFLLIFEIGARYINDSERKYNIAANILFIQKWNKEFPFIPSDYLIGIYYDFLICDENFNSYMKDEVWFALNHWIGFVGELFLGASNLVPLKKRSAWGDYSTMYTLPEKTSIIIINYTIDDIRTKIHQHIIQTHISPNPKKKSFSFVKKRYSENYFVNGKVSSKLFFE